MNIRDLSNIIFDKPFIIPRSFMLNYKKLNITDTEFVILVYLLSKDNNVLNYTEISEILGEKLTDVVSIIHSLKDKKLIEILTVTKENILTEVFSLELLKHKLTTTLVNKQTNSIDVSLLPLFEDAFARSLSPIEISHINELSSKYDNSTIKNALSEAALNGVTNINYVIKIIENKTNTNNKQNKKIEVPSYNWLDE